MSGVDKAAVLGAGTMGHGIAQVLAMAGVEVTLCDLEQSQLDHALEAIEVELHKPGEYGTRLGLALETLLEEGP